MASQTNLTKYTKKNLYWSFSNSPKIEEEWTLPMTFWEAITLIPPPPPKKKKKKKERKRKNLQPNIFDEYRCKNFQQIISKLNPTTHKKDHTPWPSGMHLKFNIHKWNNMIHYINKRKDKNHMIISKDTEKKYLTKFKVNSW